MSQHVSTVAEGCHRTCHDGCCETWPSRCSTSRTVRTDVPSNLAGPLKPYTGWGRMGTSGEHCASEPPCLIAGLRIRAGLVPSELLQVSDDATGPPWHRQARPPPPSEVRADPDQLLVRVPRLRPDRPAGVPSRKARRWAADAFIHSPQFSTKGVAGCSLSELPFVKCVKLSPLHHSGTKRGKANEDGGHKTANVSAEEGFCLGSTCEL